MSRKSREEIISAYNVRDKQGKEIQLGKTDIRRKTADPIIYQQSLVKKRIQELKSDLPHLYGWPFYQWGREFFESTNRMNLLCAANQIGKSSIAIIKNIEWACNKKLWPTIWDTPPKQFWYFYPTGGNCSSEVEKKWIPEFLPRGEMKNHECYGWDVQYNHGDVEAIHFRSGVSIYFKTYGQKILNLQSSTVHMITADEELPEEFINELLARLRSNRGVYNQIFTATRGLQTWYRAMECIGTSEEMFTSAWKRSVSMRDCMYYEDGTPSKWTPERIAEAEQQCTSKAEILKRIDGRFVREEGRKFSAFDPELNVIRKTGDEKLDNWRYYAAVDIGSGSGGGKKRSAAAIVIIAVNPDNSFGRVVRTWRGDGEETTAGDILRKYVELKSGLIISQACYDYQSREFGLISSRYGEPFIPADKSRESGSQTVNILFQSRRLIIDDGEYDNLKLVTELMSIPVGEKNRNYQDDLADALRYCVKLIPWDFEKISPDYKESFDLFVEDEEDENKVRRVVSGRRGEEQEERDDNYYFQQEVAAWNELYGN